MLQRCFLMLLGMSTGWGGMSCLATEPTLDFRIELTTAQRGYDGQMCWVPQRGARLGNFGVTEISSN